jgi:hypothetical protein
MLGEKRTGALLEKTRVMVGKIHHLYYNWPHELRSRFARRITHKAGRAPSFAEDTDASRRRENSGKMARDRRMRRLSGIL